MKNPENSLLNIHVNNVLLKKTYKVYIEKYMFFFWFHRWDVIWKGVFFLSDTPEYERTAFADIHKTFCLNLIF